MLWDLMRFNGMNLPRKVLEMNSETWFPDRLISDRWVSSLFSILLNWSKEAYTDILIRGDRKIQK